MVWLSGLVPYQQAEQILARIGEVALSSSTIWRTTQTYGGRLQAVAEMERAQAMALPVQGILPRPLGAERKRMGVALDGTMVHIRQEGWKELKVGSVFEIAVEPTTDEGSQEVLDLAHAVDNSYVAYLGGPEVFGQQMWVEACRRGWADAVDTEVVGDGAPWIWNLVSTHFGFSQQVVDWYHAKEHLALAARLVEGEGTPAARRWLREWETPLYQGHAARIADELTTLARAHPPLAADLLREAAYFRTNQRRMNYLELRKEGWVIGSGMVESAGKQYKARFAGPGMRWTRSGATNLLPIRTAIMSHRFDDLWRKAYNSPPA